MFSNMALSEFNQDAAHCLSKYLIKREEERIFPLKVISHLRKLHCYDLDNDKKINISVTLTYQSIS